MASNKAGKVTQVLGAVVDVAFEGELPPILNALSKAASSLRIAGFFIETHPNPETALSDGPNMVYLQKMPGLLNAINKINKAAK